VIVVPRICLVLSLLALLVPATAGAAQRTAPLTGVVVAKAGPFVLVAGSHGNVTAVRGRAAVGARVVFAHGRLVRALHARAATIRIADRVVRAAGREIEVQPAEPEERAEVEIVGVVTAVGMGSVTLLAAGQTLTIPLPAGVTPPASLVGARVELELSFGGVAADEDRHDARHGGDGGDRGPGGGGR